MVGLLGLAPKRQGLLELDWNDWLVASDIPLG